MTKTVLIVDDDMEMLRSLQQGLERYQDTFSVGIAESGEKAVALLKRQPVSLMVTDLKMPAMDGFELLGHVMQHYPDVPVIIMTGYSTPEMKHLAKRGGAVGYIAKPFLVENLARKIVTTLKRETEGGTLHGVSSGIFLQLIEMEERTCTIRLSEKQQKKNGVLFFKEGELLDARYGNLMGVEAAYEIFSWENVSIAIQNGCPQNEKKIEEDLQAVLLEAMRRKDERTEAGGPDTAAASDAPGAAEDDPTGEDLVARVRGRLESELGGLSVLQDIYPDPKWDPSFSRLEAMASALGGGRLKLAFVDKGDAARLLLVPGKPTVVAKIDAKAPGDRIIQILARL